MTEPEETGGSGAALEAVVAWINGERRTAHGLRERFPVGTARALLAREPRGAGAVQD